MESQKVHLWTSNEVVSFEEFKEAELRIFFMCFLIVHLAMHFYMDGDLGFTPPKPYALPCPRDKPQIAVHILRCV